MVAGLSFYSNPPATAGREATAAAARPAPAAWMPCCTAIHAALRKDGQAPIRACPGGGLAASAAQVEPVQLHHPVPGGDEVVDKPALAVLAGVHLGQRAQHRIGTEHQVDAGPGELLFAAGAITSF